MLLSVVIPVLDDAGVLDNCLRSLRHQTLAAAEVIVVDNGSADDSAAVARRHGARVITETRPGIAAAAAAGYHAAAGDLIVRCDADSLPPAGWLATIEATFAADPNLAALTGPGDFYGLGRLRGRVLSLLYMRGYFLATGAALARYPLFGSNMAIRRRVWTEISESVHTFDAEVHDDIDLSIHLGPVRHSRLDWSLRVGISGRAFANRTSVARRFRRGMYTLRQHWPEQYPWLQWQQRVTAQVATRRRQGARETAKSARG